MIESIALSVKRFREDLPCLYDVEVSDQKYVNQEVGRSRLGLLEVKGKPVFMLVTVLR
jgi:hypothetical protein